MWSWRNLSRSTLTTACEQFVSRGVGALVGRWSLLGSADAFDVELAGPVEPVDAVLLLEHIGQLGVAVTERPRVVEQNSDQPFESPVELLLVTNALSIPPRLGAGSAVAVQGVRVPPDSAEFGDEVGLPGVGLGELSTVAAVRPRPAVCQAGLMLCEAGRVLLVVVAVPNLGLQDAVGIAGRVQHRTGGVGELGGQEHAASDVVEHGDPVVQDLVGLIQRAPADDAGMVDVALQHLQ